MTPSHTQTTNCKHAFRKKARALRTNIRDQHPSAATQAASIFIHHFNPTPAIIIALYHSCGSELETKPLAEALIRRGVPVCLPTIAAADTPLVFRYHNHNQPLIAGRHGIKTPPESAPCVLPDLVVVPLLAFQENGARLGQGGGYYDRTLQSLQNSKPVTSVGYAYEAQLLSQFPVAPHDQYLDYIITDQRVIHSAAIRKTTP